jgi:hypothetical protein
MNENLQIRSIDLNIEVLDHRVELMAAAAGTTTSTTSTTCGSPIEVAA